MTINLGLLVRRVVPFALALGIWFAPVPAGLTAPAWHLFAIFVSAITAVLDGAFPLLTSTTLAAAAVVLTGTISAAKAFAGFANTSVLLVVIAFLVAQAVVKSGLGRRISLFMVGRFGRSSLGLAYSIVITDALIAPAFPSNTARCGVLYPIVLSVAQGSGSRPDDPEKRRLGGYLMFCAMASLSVSSALWMTATSKMAPLNQYLMTDRNAEIALARSAAPESISRDAEVLVLGWHGYETAVKGKNGFVCVVERSWMAPFDDPEFLNPDQRLPLCLNPPAARTHLPLTFRMTDLALAGLSKAQMFDNIKVAFDKKAPPLPEPGSMCYMMSKQQYFGRKYGNADPHLMFWFPKTGDMFWGGGLPGAPVYVHQYSPEPITEFIISVSKWSDETSAPTD